jgi:putative phosphoribosyl transferase
VVLAVLAAAIETVRDLTGVDEIVCVETPRQFGAVGQYYADFTATRDDEVVVLLDTAERRLHEAVDRHRLDQRGGLWTFGPSL